MEERDRFSMEDVFNTIFVRKFIFTIQSWRGADPKKCKSFIAIDPVDATWNQN